MEEEAGEGARKAGDGERGVGCCRGLIFGPVRRDRPYSLVQLL